MSVESKTSDDTAMIKQIQKSHAPDDGLKFDVKPLLYLVEDILNHATIKTDTANASGTIQAHSYQYMADRIHYAGVLDKISCEIVCKCMNGTDAHATTVSIFNLLSKYSWEAKLVLTLAAFALNYGEFWLPAQIYSSNQLAKSMAALRQLPVIENAQSLKPQFDALNNLIKIMLKVTWSVVNLNELPSSDIAHDLAELDADRTFVPTTVYLTIRSGMTCATNIHKLCSIGQGYVVSTSVTSELSSLTLQISNISERFVKLLISCNQSIERKREDEYVKMLREVFNVQIHTDNEKPLKLLINAGKDDILQSLFDGASKKRVTLDVLRTRNVLLLISGLDMSQDELAILKQIHKESQIHSTNIDHRYEIVWIPIVDPSIEGNNQLMETQFKTLQATMPWYSVHHPQLIQRAVIRFVREEWQFKNKPILVVLDPQAKVVSPNAIHMMWIWGSIAFPFTTMREETLWKEESYKLELLFSRIDQTLVDWIKEGKHIFMYGGEDIEWIKKFTSAARALESCLRIPIKMVYVGSSGIKEAVIRKIKSTITTEELGYCWIDHPQLIWFFWTRLESILFSKIHLRQAAEKDSMTQEIKKLLNYDKSGGGWAVLSKGSTVILTTQELGTAPVVAGSNPLAWLNPSPAGGTEMPRLTTH